MTILSKHSPTEVVYILNVSYEGLYAKLKEVLNPEELRLFAAPGRKSMEHYWYTEADVAFKPFSRASQDEQNEAAIQLEVQKAAIMPKLTANPELAKFAEQLFRMPSDNELLLLEDASRKPYITLVQWGCRLARGDKNVNPLEKIINWPRPDHSQVTLELFHSDGEKITDAPFTVLYKSRINYFISNAQGEVALGRVKHGEQISVWEGQAETGKDTQAFEVLPNQEQYALFFPFYHPFTIRVTDQEDQVLTNVSLELIYGSTKRSHQTGEDGLVVVSDISLKKDSRTITIQQKNYPETAREFNLDRQTKEIHFQLEQLQYGQLTIQVLDKEAGQPVQNYPLELAYDGQKNSYQSDANGNLYLELPVGTQLTITDGHNQHNNTDHVLERGKQNLVFYVKKPQPEIITVRLVNRKDSPIPEVPISLSMAGETFHTTTDAQGECHVKRPIPKGEKHFNAQFSLLNKKGKEKKYTRRVKFIPGQTVYTIKIKPFNWRWLLLLLLLLPLLLLIELEKDISVITLKGDTRDVVPNAEVNLSYVRYALFDEGRFFVADTVSLSEKSDSAGLTTFERLNYTVYSWVFHNLFRANIWTDYPCYDFSAAYPRFHWVRREEPVELLLISQPMEMDFMVVDADDNQPLPDAMVVVNLENHAIDSALSGVDGRVLFKSLPRCGTLSMVTGQLEGYYPDTLRNLQIAKINGKATGKRTLRLKPIRKKITFFVTDCRNGEPLPDARAMITIEDGASNQSQTYRTNINGVGKGEYDDLHITKKLRIDVEKPYYKPGVIGKDLTVGEFIALPDSLRTICLEPLANTIDFQNIDSLTNKPISGVTNVVTISNGARNRTDTLISNRNGVFAVPDVKVGDKITIVSTNPYYYPNKHTIVDNDAQALLESSPQQRKIPLTPIAPPCNTSGSADYGQDYYLEEYNMGQSQGKFLFEYYTDSEPDLISVYCAKKGDISPANRIFGPVSSSRLTSKWLQLNCNIISVEVKGDTNWEYTVHCPE